MLLCDGEQFGILSKEKNIWKLSSIKCRLNEFPTSQINILQTFLAQTYLSVEKWKITLFSFLFMVTNDTTSSRKKKQQTNRKRRIWTNTFDEFHARFVEILLAIFHFTKCIALGKPCVQFLSCQKKWEMKRI